MKPIYLKEAVETGGGNTIILMFSKPVALMPNKPGLVKCYWRVPISLAPFALKFCFDFSIGMSVDHFNVLRRAEERISV